MSAVTNEEQNGHILGNAKGVRTPSLPLFQRSRIVGPSLSARFRCFPPPGARESVLSVLSAEEGSSSRFAYPALSPSAPLRWHLCCRQLVLWKFAQKRSRAAATQRRKGDGAKTRPKEQTVTHIHVTPP